MATYLLDTNVIIDAINGRDGRPEYLEGLLEKGILLACTSVNITEVYMGMRPSEARPTKALLESLEFYPVTWEIAQLAGQLFGEWHRKGITLSLADVTIAAVCIHNGLKLVSDNVKHFPMKELRAFAPPSVV